MNDANDVVVWRFPVAFVLVFLFGMLTIGIMSFNGLKEMVHVWGYREEYGYGYIIPFISLFLIWQKYPILEKEKFTSSWVGVLVVAIGCMVVLVGRLTTITTIIQYGALLVLLGFIYSFSGKSIKPILVPLLFLIFMIPLPGFFINNLSSQLQLISSEIGVSIIRFFNISVYLEGNVIDLGSFQLQVVEACSGLNYLFPLMSLAFITAYFFKAPLWQRFIIFISSIPITIFMNSFRIGVIGLLVNKWGIAQAKGFLHYFEGWVIFMACMIILFGEMLLFIKFSSDKKRLSEVFGIEIPGPRSSVSPVKFRSIPAPLVLSFVFLIIAMIISLKIEDRKEIIPARVDFDSFPSTIGRWAGEDDIIEKKYLDILKLDDYILSNYRNNNADTINFYAAYYKSQRSGASAHSPRSCIPGGGWRIKQFSTIELKHLMVFGKPLSVNRLLIQKGDYRQLVYYWFQQRGRIITNEYMVKWYLFWDALTKNRTDGALIRVTTPVSQSANLKDADKLLVSFLKLTEPLMDKYIPK